MLFRFAAIASTLWIFFCLSQGMVTTPSYYAMSGLKRFMLVLLNWGAVTVTFWLCFYLVSKIIKFLDRATERINLVPWLILLIITFAISYLFGDGIAAIFLVTCLIIILKFSQKEPPQLSHVVQTRATTKPGQVSHVSHSYEGDVGRTDKYLDRGAVYSNRDFERDFGRDYSRSRDGSTMSASEQDAAFDRDYSRSRDGDIGGYGESEGNGEGGGSGGYRD